MRTEEPKWRAKPTTTTTQKWMKHITPNHVIIHTNYVHWVFHWWISRHGNKSKYKIQFVTCSFGNKGTEEYLVKNFVICCLLGTKILMHLNLEAFVLVCCIFLNLFDQSFMGIDILNSLKPLSVILFVSAWLLMGNYFAEVVEREMAGKNGKNLALVPLKK